MSPYEIKLLLHWHCCIDNFPHDTAPVYAPTMARMISDGLITRREDDTRFYNTTARGKKLVEMLCNTPYPIEGGWVDPREVKS